MTDIRKPTVGSWLSIPPVVAILTFFVTRIFCRGPISLNVIDRSIWTMAILLFIVLSILYCMFIVHNWHDGLLPIQLIAQGQLLCPLALAFGARIFQWIGVILTVCGVSALIVKYHRQQVQQAIHLSMLAESDDNKDSRLPIPFAITDNKGSVLRVSTPMLIAANMTRDQVLGKTIHSLLTILNDETAQVNGEIWALKQLPMGEGCHYFQINKIDSAFMPGASSFADSSEAVNPGIDAETGLMETHIALERIGEEIYRTRRYGRQLTTAMVRLVFPEESNRDGTANAAFRAWCSLVGRNLREPDIVSATSKRDLIIALPECPKNAAHAVIQKLLLLVTNIAKDHPVLADITPLYVYKTFEGTDTVPDTRELIEQMSQDLERKYTLKNENEQDGM